MTMTTAAPASASSLVPSSVPTEETGQPRNRGGEHTFQERINTFMGSRVVVPGSPGNDPVPALQTTVRAVEANNPVSAVAANDSPPARGADQRTAQAYLNYLQGEALHLALAANGKSDDEVCQEIKKLCSKVQNSLESALNAYTEYRGALRYAEELLEGVQMVAKRDGEQ